MTQNICKTCKQPLKITLSEYPNDGLEYKKIQGLDNTYYINTIGQVYSTKRQKFMSMFNRGYLLPVNRINKRFSAVRLVAQYFYPNYENIKDPHIQHKDDNKDNINIENLHVF